jgi:hypothetical protein
MSKLTFAIVTAIVAFGFVLGGTGLSLAEPAPVPPAPSPRLVTKWVEPSPGAEPLQVLPLGERRIIFMNRNGGTYSPGDNNSSANVSSIPNQVSTIPPWPYSDAAWEQFMLCSIDMFGRFNIEVTDIDPGGVEHIESVMGGHPADVQMDPGVGGVSPFSCGIIDRSIVYTFAEIWGNNPQRLCEVAAQEIAHSFGLEHEMLCSDPLTYLPDCGPKTFQDIDAACGEYTARPCSCGDGGLQNTVQHFTALVGPAEATPPTLVVNAPQENDIVNPGFQVLVTVTDNYAVDKTDLYIDGGFATTSGLSPFTLTAPTNIPVGAHQLEIRAYDVGGNMTSQTVNVTVMGDCDQAGNACDVGFTCVQGVCLGDVGTTCNGSFDCATGLCAAIDRWDNICTFLCDPAASDCPDGYDCVTGNGGNLFKCWPAEPDDGMCAAGSPSGRRARSLAPLAGLALGFGALFVFGRRRR